MFVRPVVLENRQTELRFIVSFTIYTSFGLFIQWYFMTKHPFFAGDRSSRSSVSSVDSYGHISPIDMEFNFNDFATNSVSSPSENNPSTESSRDPLSSVNSTESHHSSFSEELANTENRYVNSPSLKLPPKPKEGTSFRPKEAPKCLDGSNELTLNQNNNNRLQTSTQRPKKLVVANSIRYARKKFFAAAQDAAHVKRTFKKATSPVSSMLSRYYWIPKSISLI